MLFDISVSQKPSQQKQKIVFYLIVYSSKLQKTSCSLVYWQGIELEWQKIIIQLTTNLISTIVLMEKCIE
jgi:hypothetical protein